MTKQERQDYLFYIIDLYNQWIDQKENRNPSYGELNYIESLKIKELKEMEKELLKELIDNDK